MNKIRAKTQKWFPAWEMPSDPVKAVWWFLYWLLQVIVRYCWLLIAIAAVIVGYMNGIKFGIGSGLVGGIATILVGVVVWIVLRGVLQLATAWMNVTRAIREAQQMQESFYDQFNNYSSPYSNGYQSQEGEKNIVEGTIVEVKEEPEQEQKQ